MLTFLLILYALLNRNSILKSLLPCIFQFSELALLIQLLVLCHIFFLLPLLDASSLLFLLCSLPHFFLPFHLLKSVLLIQLPLSFQFLFCDLGKLCLFFFDLFVDVFHPLATGLFLLVTFTLLLNLVQSLTILLLGCRGWTIIPCLGVGLCIGNHRAPLRLAWSHWFLRCLRLLITSVFLHVHLCISLPSLLFLAYYGSYWCWGFGHRYWLRLILRLGHVRLGKWGRLFLVEYILFVEHSV